MARRDQHDPSDDITRARPVAPKLKYETEVQESVATPEWSGDDEPVELPAVWDDTDFAHKTPNVQLGDTGTHEIGHVTGDDPDDGLETGRSAPGKVHGVVQKAADRGGFDSEAGTLKESFIEIGVDGADPMPHESMSLNFADVPAGYTAMPELDANANEFAVDEAPTLDDPLL